MTNALASELRIATENGYAWIELNRPERGNALSARLVEALLESVNEQIAERSVHTIVLCAAGPHFCTGFDLDGLDRSSDGELLQRFVRIETLLDTIWRAPIRTIAIAHGRAIGAGADLFVACDERLLVPGATLRFPGAGFGLVLGTRRLAERVGRSRALRWVSTNSVITASEAVEARLADTLTAVLPADAASGTEALALMRWREACVPPPPAIDRATIAALKAGSAPGADGGEASRADSDLAALVRSAAKPGLRERLVAYRDRNTRR